MLLLLLRCFLKIYPSNLPVKGSWIQITLHRGRSCSELKDDSLVLAQESGFLCVRFPVFQLPACIAALMELGLTDRGSFPF